MVNPTTLVIGIAILLVSSVSATFTAIFYNNCEVSVSVEMTAGYGKTTSRSTVGAGGNINHPFEPVLCQYVDPGVKDGCGGSTMLFYQDGASGALTAEYGNRAEKDGVQRMWSNWSNDKGIPWLDKVSSHHSW